MLEIINKKGNTNLVSMGEMEPLQVGQIEDYRAAREDGHYVLRTADATHFEVIDLTEPGINNCWRGKFVYNVRLLEPGEVLIIKLFNVKENL